MPRLLSCCLVLALFATGCAEDDEPATTPDDAIGTMSMDERLAQYTTVTLDPDLSGLTDNQREMIPLLIEAAEIMDDIFWRQNYSGDRGEAVVNLPDDVREYFALNYGPWDRLNGDEPFIDGAGRRPLGGNFYPVDMTQARFDELTADMTAEEIAELKSLYTMVRYSAEDMDDLEAIPYHVYFEAEHRQAADLLRRAAQLAEDAGFRRYLELRADALETGDYQPSDMAWMDMKDNTLDVVIGPIETYDDQLFGAKAAHEAYVLVKDREWSGRLQRYAALLPNLQRGLPVPDEYKAETPGTDADLGAYDVLYYAGEANAGSKTIAINLPNDEDVQLAKGSRRLQLKNAMQAKFDKILEPIADVLVVPEQRDHVTFDAFFANTMFHEVAHGLGIKETLNGRGSVREALGNQASALEEGKADVLGLYMVTRLHEMGELGDADLMDNYVTFMTSIFRSIRFGATSAHGRANLARFNYFMERGAFQQDDEGRFRVDTDAMQAAMNALSEQILRFQGDGDYQGVTAFADRYEQQSDVLTAALARVRDAEIPKDVIFDQGLYVLDL